MFFSSIILFMNGKLKFASFSVSILQLIFLHGQADEYKIQMEIHSLRWDLPYTLD